MSDVAGRTIDGWRAGHHPLRLTPDDLDLVDLVLSLYPELRVVLEIGQRMRVRRISYPVRSAQVLLDLLGDETVVAFGHRIDAASVAEAMHDEWFPVAHEGELLSVVHLALVRCRHEGARRRVASLHGADAARGGGGRDDGARDDGGRDDGGAD